LEYSGAKVVPHVIIQDAPSMNLLGLILASILERNLVDPRRKQIFEKLSGDVVVQAGEMVVTLAFDQGKLAVSRGAVARPKASIRGSLDTLMRLSLGGGMVGPTLSGRLKPRGNLLLLLKMRRLLCVD
jgi:hypothetical protein